MENNFIFTPPALQAFDNRGSSSRSRCREPPTITITDGFYSKIAAFFENEGTCIQTIRKQRVIL